MNPYNFGEAITYKFAIYDDKFGGYKSLADVTDAPAIYIYNHKPTRENAITGGDSPVKTITSWSDDTDTTGKKFTITAISDPEPNNEYKVHEYWIAINYKLVNSGDSHLDLRLFRIARPKVTGAPLIVDHNTLEDIFAKISSYATPTEQADKIVIARSLVSAEFEFNGFEWCELYEPKDLNLAISYRALSEIFFGSRFVGIEEIKELAITYKENSDKLIKYLKLKFTNQQNGQPESDTSKENIAGTIRFVR